MKLYKREPMTVTVNGKKYRMRPWFNVVLWAIDAYQRIGNDALPSICKRLIVGHVSNPDEVVAAAMQALIPPVSEDAAKQPRLYDFEQDAARIYAGFMQAYRIDLYEQQDKLHWSTFVELFVNLPSDTQMAKVMSIRATPIPPATKHNGDYIADLLRQKNAVALIISDEERQQNFAEGAKRLFDAMAAQARKV